jgi:hypothetical protein
MAYAYKVKGVGVRLDFDSNPPELAYAIFPSGNWESVTVDPSEKHYEFIFQDKQETAYSNPFIQITETEI